MPKRRVVYFRRWLTVWPERTNYFLQFCRYICRVVRATWSEYAVAGYSENIFLYVDDVMVQFPEVACRCGRNRSVLLVLHFFGQRPVSGWR